MSKENADNVLTNFNETVDKFHRALCPKCNGNCHVGSSCEYDYSHTHRTEVNEMWQRYVKQVLELANEWEMTPAEILKIMKKEGKMTKEEYSKVEFLEFLFRKL